MEVHEFVARYPRLFHLAHGDAWPGLQRHGLLSAGALVALMEAPDPAALLNHRRPTSHVLTHPQHGTAVLRDQGPLNVAKLAGALTDGTTVEQWLELLNGMVFLFPSGRALQPMLRAYSHDPVLLLTVNTRSLVREYEPSIRLAHINTGSTAYAPAPRGPGTFVGIRRFDHRKRTVKEVAISYGIRDLKDHVIRAERRLPDGTVQDLLP